MALDPTKCEQELERAVNTGDLVDLRSGDVEFDDPVRGAEWGHDRAVRGEVLYDLLVARTSRAVVLCGARISGGLNLEAATLACPLILEGCFCDSPINLRDARAPVIRVTGCQLVSLVADQLDVRGDLDLTRSTTEIISLRAAHVGGNLVLDASTLTGGTWPPDLAGTTLVPPVADASAKDEKQIGLSGDDRR